MSERDTHFRGFAQLLWEEMMRSEAMPYTIAFTREQADTFIQLIAQRAYDLVGDAVIAASAYQARYPDTYIPEHRLIALVSDVKAFPKEEA